MYRLVLLVLSLSTIGAAAEWTGVNTIECYVKEGEKFAVVEIYSHAVDIHKADSDLHLNGSKAKLLYTITSRLKNRKGEYSRSLALISTSNRQLKIADLNWFHSVKDKNRKIIKDSSKYNDLKKEWLEAFREKLNSRAEKYEDTELEYLLSLKFFNKPLKGSYKSWKNDLPCRSQQTSF